MFMSAESRADDVLCKLNKMKGDLPEVPEVIALVKRMRLAIAKTYFLTNALVESLEKGQREDLRDYTRNTWDLRLELSDVWRGLLDFKVDHRKDKTDQVDWSAMLLNSLSHLAAYEAEGLTNFLTEVHRAAQGASDRLLDSPSVTNEKFKWMRRLEMAKSTNEILLSGYPEFIQKEILTYRPNPDISNEELGQFRSDQCVV